MNVGEILRKVADVVDSEADRSSQEQEILQATHQAEISGAVTASNELQAGQVAQLVQAASNMKLAMGAEEAHTHSIVPTFPGQASAMDLTSADNTDGTSDETMVSPLQQQHELLKKSQGVENNVSEFADSAEPQDSLDIMKKMAGIGEDNGPVDHGADIRQGQQSLNPRANAALEANGKPHLPHTSRRAR